tara:strand:- start:1320 stop:1979 length:660 start_codon:yes stop_codon:yes gene_type:complete
MELYTLLRDYATETRAISDPRSLTPELGRALSLFHTCMIEGGMNKEPVLGTDHITDPPKALTPPLLSRFIIGYLSNSDNKLENHDILFEIYSFISWMNKKRIPHGLEKIDFQKTTKEIMEQSERCHEISSLIDSLTEENLDDPPTLHETWHDVFSVMRILANSIYLHGQKGREPVRLYLPANLTKLIRKEDRMELTLASTVERWIIIEQTEIFPGHFHH